jgi:hypothetical protein
MSTEQKNMFDSCVNKTYSSISSAKSISLDELKRQCYQQVSQQAKAIGYSGNIVSSCDKNMEEAYNYYQSYTKEMAESDCMLKLATQTKDPSLCDSFNNIEEKENCKRLATNLSEIKVVNNNTYFDKFLNFSIEHPEGWNFSVEKWNSYTPEGVYMASLGITGPNKNETNNCRLDTRPLNSTLAIKDYFDMMVNQNYKDYEIISEGENSINSYKAYEGVLTDANISSEILKNTIAQQYSNVMLVIVIRNKTVFFIRCFASPSTFDKYKPDFDFIINSLNFE